MADFYIGQGDTASTLQVTLRDSAGNAVPYTGGSVHIDVTPIHGGATTSERVMSGRVTATCAGRGAPSCDVRSARRRALGDARAGEAARQCAAGSFSPAFRR